MSIAGIVITVLVVGLCAAISEWWYDRKRLKELRETMERQEAMARQDAVAQQAMDESDNKISTMEETKGTRDLFLETLAMLGCQYELAEEEDDNRIFFTFQGEHFSVSATNESFFIHIYDLQWLQVDLYDVDEFARLRKAINESNIYNNVTTLYTIDEEEGKVNVHSKSIILFIPQIPRIDNYLGSELSAFFRAHRYVTNEMEKLRTQEKATV